MLQVIFFYSLNFFSLEFHLSLFYLFWCLLFFCSYSWSYWRNFSCYFFCLVNLVTFLFVFLLKKNHRNFCFSIFSSKRKKEKKTMDLFFTFLLMIPSCKLCFDDFFFFVRSFVCLLVCCNPGKTNNNNKRKVKEREKTETKKLRHVSNDTVQCSSVLVLEVVFDGLGQV